MRLASRKKIQSISGQLFMNLRFAPQHKKGRPIQDLFARYLLFDALSQNRLPRRGIPMQRRVNGGEWRMESGGRDALKLATRDSPNGITAFVSLAAIPLRLAGRAFDAQRRWRWDYAMHANARPTVDPPAPPLPRATAAGIENSSSRWLRTYSAPPATFPSPR